MLGSPSTSVWHEPDRALTPRQDCQQFGHGSYWVKDLDVAFLFEEVAIAVNIVMLLVWSLVVDVVEDVRSIYHDACLDVVALWQEC